MKILFTFRSSSATCVRDLNDRETLPSAPWYG